MTANVESSHSRMVNTDPQLPWCSWELITPEKAEQYLGLNIDNNRGVKTHHIAAMALDMAEGRWVTTHQGIAFNQSGQFFDGQNRLHAIIRSGLPQWLPVWRNVSNEAMMVTDGVKPRTSQDICRIRQTGFSAKHVATARVLHCAPGPISPDLSTYFLVDVAIEHQEAIEFSHLAGTSSPFVASVRGCIARAWYSADRDRLSAFMGVLKEGYPVDITKDRAAVSLSRIIRDTKGQGNQQVQIVMYQKTQSALRYFLDDYPATKIYGCKEDLFPLPG